MSAASVVRRGLCRPLFRDGMVLVYLSLDDHFKKEMPIAVKFLIKFTVLGLLLIFGK
jgi:hypothetical protein